MMRHWHLASEDLHVLPARGTIDITHDRIRVVVQVVFRSTVDPSHRRSEVLRRAEDRFQVMKRWSCREKGDGG